jgi:CRP/FNR family nitrogen fixation transcriptional regulator
MHTQASGNSLRPGSAGPLPHVNSLTAPKAFQQFATIRRWQREQDIVSQDGQSESWYCIISGAARQCLIRRDGRRQIVDILLPGDLFGMTPDGGQRFAVQAVAENTIVASYPRQRVEALMESNPQIVQDMQRRVFETMARLQEHLLIVGTMTSIEKVRAFLGYMTERLPPNPDGGIVLPLSRYDIADQLGISAETVSRAISALKSNGAIQLGGPRQVQLLGADEVELPD